VKSITWTGNETDYEMVDLTHVIREGIPYWVDHPKFSMKQVSSLEDGAVASVHALCLCEHTGTHFDAPSHYILGAPTIVDIPIQRFFGRAAHIEVKAPAPDSALPAQVILDFEAEHGPLERGDAVILSFGWHKLWNEPTHFLKDWPGISEDAAKLLVSRQVRLVATDCLSIDHFTSTAFPAHVALLGAGILIGENFANLGSLPPWSFLTALPLPIDKGTGSPVRAIAFVPKGQ
jgi:arylformamidase